MDFNDILILLKAGFTAEQLREMVNQPQPQTQTQPQPGIDNNLLTGLIHSISSLQNAIQSQAIFNSLQPQIPNGAQKADDALASIVLPGNMK